MMRQITQRRPQGSSRAPAIPIRGFLDHDGSARVAWLRASGSAQQILDGPIAGASVGSEMRALPATGYSHHVVATGTPGVYLGAWTAGAEPTQDIFVRVFSR